MDEIGLLDRIRRCFGLLVVIILYCTTDVVVVYYMHQSVKEQQHFKHFKVFKCCCKSAKII